MPAAPAAVDGLTADEIEREWIYDSGAAFPFIGCDNSTDDEKKRTYQVPELTLTTAGGLVRNSTAVICNVPTLASAK